MPISYFKKRTECCDHVVLTYAGDFKHTSPTKLGNRLAVFRERAAPHLGAEDLLQRVLQQYSNTFTPIRISGTNLLSTHQELLREGYLDSVSCDRHYHEFFWQIVIAKHAKDKSPSIDDVLSLSAFAVPSESYPAFYEIVDSSRISLLNSIANRMIATEEDNSSSLTRGTTHSFQIGT